MSLDRRRVLRLAGGTALAALAPLTGCTYLRPKPAGPEPLLGQETAARTDAQWAKAAAAAVPERAAVLDIVATQRGEHAQALRAEIDRALGVYRDGTRPATANAPVEIPAPPSPLTVAALQQRLMQSQQSAADLTHSLSGYRAGLLASISACCATHAGALLA